MVKMRKHEWSPMAERIKRKRTNEDGKAVVTGYSNPNGTDEMYRQNPLKLKYFQEIVDELQLQF